MRAASLNAAQQRIRQTTVLDETYLERRRFLHHVVEPFFLRSHLARCRWWIAWFSSRFRQRSGLGLSLCLGRGGLGGFTRISAFLFCVCLEYEP